ncbi:hypothetical protein [Aquimarina algiphila]|nr:hypothetical protein [Aquimarina algiphila]
MYIVTHFGTEKELIEALEIDKVQLLVGIKKHGIYDHQFAYIKNEELELICSNTIDIPENIENNERELTKWLQKQTWFVYDNDQSDINFFWETNFNKSLKIIPRYILPSYLDIIEVLKKNNGFSVVPKHLFEKELKDNLIKTPINSAKKSEQKLFYSYKLKNSNLKEINKFIEGMKN